jgi:hypothetical protein
MMYPEKFCKDIGLTIERLPLLSVYLGNTETPITTSVVEASDGVIQRKIKAGDRGNVQVIGRVSNSRSTLFRMRSSTCVVWKSRFVSKSWLPIFFSRLTKRTFRMSEYLLEGENSFFYEMYVTCLDTLYENESIHTM